MAAADELSDRFEQAQADVQALPQRPSNADLLELYANYKQATVGEASAAKAPGRFDLIGKAKYDAWTTKAGLSTDAAMRAYIEIADRLIGH